MKNWLVRSILLITAAVMCLPLVACSDFAPKAADGRTVLTIGGKKINYDCYRYVFLNTRDDLDGGDHSIWNGNYSAQAELNDAVLEVLVRNTAIEKLADKYGVKLSASEKRKISEDVKAGKNIPAETGSDGQPGKYYDDLLKEAYLTENSAYYVSYVTAVWGKIYDYVTDETNGVIKCSDSELAAAVPEKFTCIAYVFISRDTENALSLAIEAREKAESGTDFSDVVLEYCDDPNMRSMLEHGYYYVEGEIIDAVADEAAELGIGQISGVIDAMQGYFVIKRLPIDTEYVLSDLSTFRTKYFAYIFNRMVDETAAGLKIKFSGLYSSLTVETVK